MRSLMVLATTSVFLGLGMLHLYWASGGRAGSGAAVPRVDGSAAFSPTPAATVIVALALFAAAGVVALAGGAIRLPLPRWMMTGAASVLAAILALRAVGDFRLVGFFKTRGEGRFAELDTFVYSPLCLALAGAIAFIIMSREVSV
jgi:hypothetical protein